MQQYGGLNACVIGVGVPLGKRRRAQQFPQRRSQRRRSRAYDQVDTIRMWQRNAAQPEGRERGAIDTRRIAGADAHPARAGADTTHIRATADRGQHPQRAARRARLLRGLFDNRPIRERRCRSRGSRRRDRSSAGRSRIAAQRGTDLACELVCHRADHHLQRLGRGSHHSACTESTQCIGVHRRVLGDAPPQTCCAGIDRAHVGVAPEGGDPGDGARIVALVNAPGSPLAQLADELLPLHAGDEPSVAATKSYIASLADALQRAPEQLASACQRDWSAAVAKALSAAELRHGPMALVQGGFPLLLFTQNDESRAGITQLAAERRHRAPMYCSQARTWRAPLNCRPKELIR